MADMDKKLVEAIRTKREAEGLSIRALAEVVGVSFSTLARIERGEGQPDNNSKIRLLQWLGANAEDAGLSFENVAFVHFRAGKNVRSKTVKALLKVAELVRHSCGQQELSNQSGRSEDSPAQQISLSKEELEKTAEQFRADLGLSSTDPLDSLRLEVEGVTVMPLQQASCLDAQAKKQLSGDAAAEWSAMSVPLDANNEHWAVILNDSHTIERQRVTILEEYWHILLGHKLTKIARVAEAYGRTYDKSEEHDAYYLASATLLPRSAVAELVRRKQSSGEIADTFGTSPELVDYRIKRLGLWREHAGKQVKLSRD